MVAAAGGPARANWTGIEYELNRVSVKEILDAWAARVEVDPAAFEVGRRGTWQYLDPPTVLGWVRFGFAGASFVATFTLERVIRVWLETSSPTGELVRFGPVEDWPGLQRAAEEADARTAPPVDAVAR